ncbi:hypothetical protein Y032_0043g816 [Ancylostoma ceylanicum]|uniref:Uncharacterized protein n=1 Tax=Ancylostoma ceylanicum TaxID=53326 RepID=A0A016UE86_9BILA|nr:hypothetical protein Y032_0043g816 [Ancylostoma ceylanicum]
MSHLDSTFPQAQAVMTTVSICSKPFMAREDSRTENLDGLPRATSECFLSYKGSRNLPIKSVLNAFRKHKDSVQAKC